MNWIEWSACATAVIGAYYCAKKNRVCWYLWLLSNVLWTIYAVGTKQYPLLITEFVFLVTNLYGIFKWKKEPDMYEVCDAIVKLERMGYRWLVDFGYKNAVEILRKVNEKKR